MTKSNINRLIVGLLIAILIIGGLLAASPLLQAANSGNWSFEATSTPRDSGTQSIHMRGDINKDGVVNVVDLSHCRDLIDRADTMPEADTYEFYLADADGSGTIDEADFNRIADIIDGYIEFMSFVSKDNINTGYELKNVSIYLNNASAATVSFSEGNLPKNIGDSKSVGGYVLKKTADNTFICYSTSPVSQKGKTTSVVFTHKPLSTNLAVPIKKVVEGNPPEAEVFNFTISANAQTPSAPLPDAQIVQITGAGEGTFGQIEFTTPGTYYYDIKETNGGNSQYSYDKVAYTVVVTVQNTSGGSLSSKIDAIWKIETKEDGTTDESKSDEILFTNTYTSPLPTTGSLTLSKAVEGDLADKTMGFTFIIQLSDTTYNVDFGEKGKILDGKGTITLKDGEQINLGNLPGGTTYTIKETNGDKYTTTITGSGTVDANDSKKVSGTITAGTSITEAYTNSYEYSPLVGLNLDGMPFMLLVLMAIAALSGLFLKKFKNLK